MVNAGTAHPVEPMLWIFYWVKDIIQGWRQRTKLELWTIWMYFIQFVLSLKNCSSDRWTFQLKAYFLSPHPSLPLLWKKDSSVTLYFLGADYLSFTILFLVWQQDFNFSRLHVLHVAVLFWIVCTYNSQCCIVGSWTELGRFPSHPRVFFTFSRNWNTPGCLRYST